MSVRRSAFCSVMAIWNSTSYPTSAVRRLVRFGFGGTPPRDVLVWVKAARDCLSGMSYDHLPEVLEVTRLPRGIRLLAILRVGPPREFPCSGRYPGIRGAPDYTLRCWHEALVVLAAHEALHLRSFGERHAALRRLVSGRAERIETDSELSCEHAAVRALRRHRKRHRCDAPRPAAAAA